MTTIDFGKALADAKGASFEALPIGDYDVEVAKAEAVTSSNGKPMIKTTMRVVAGPYERRPIINNFVLSLENPQATAIFFRHMKCLGLTEEFFASLGSQGSLEPVASALVGRRAKLTLGHREWQGEMRNEVKQVKPYTGAPQLAGPTGPTGPSGPIAPAPTPTPVVPTAQPMTPPATPVAAPVTAPTPQVMPVPQPQPVAPQPQVQPQSIEQVPSINSVPTMPSASVDVEGGNVSSQSAPPVPTYEAPQTPAEQSTAPTAPAPPQLPF